MRTESTGARMTTTTSDDLSVLTAPHSTEAEQAVLGSMLYDNELYHQVAEFLRDEHFYDPVHGRLFTAAASMIQRAETAADAITLAPMAEADEGVKALGGKAYLAELMAAHTSTAAALDYARFVYDLALRRSLIQVGGEIEKDAAEDQEATARVLIEVAERKLFDLAETGSTQRGFVTFADALAMSIDAAAAAYERDGGLSGVSSGLTDLDEKLGGLHPSDLIVLAGRPSMGKTALATNIAYNIARRHRLETGPDGTARTSDGGVVGFFSLEMSSEQLAMRILSERAGISGHRIRRGEIEPDEFEQVRDAATELASIPLHIDDTGGLSIAALAARARRLKRTEGLDVLVVDYLQLLTGSGRRGSENRVQEITEITTGLKALAKELQVPVIALSQLSRQVEARDDKRPQLSDLRESGSIEQDADVVMFVYREAYYVARKEPKSKQGSDEYAIWQEELAACYGKAEVIIGKQRHGPIGTVELAFEESLTKFSNLERSPRYEDMVRPDPVGSPLAR